MTRRLWGALAVVLALMILAVVPVTAFAASPTFAASPNLQEVAPLPDGELIVVTWQGLAALIGVALTVGLTGGVGGALLIVRAVRQNDVITTAIERLYLSTPPATQEQIRGMVEVVLEGGRLLDTVTDGVLGTISIPTKEVPQDESELARIQRE